MKFCPLYSGSSGNSIFVGNQDNKILIDAGLPGKRIDEALKNINESGKDIKGIFVTHEHSDHIKGVGVFSRKYNIPIYANEKTWNAMDGKIGKIKDENIKILREKFIEIGDLKIECFNISHDAAQPTGYVIHHDNKSACIATDLGYFSEEVKEKVADADILLVESNHDVEMVKFGPYPYVLKRRILSDHGHVSNEACAQAIVETMTDKKRVVFLGHLSKTNNYPDLAYKTVYNILTENKIKVDEDINLFMANRDCVSRIVEI